MLERLQQIEEEINAFQAEGQEAIEVFRLKFLSKKGTISALFNEFRELPAEMKRELGQRINNLKEIALQKFEELSNSLDSSPQKSGRSDLTRPGVPYFKGSRHPISIVRNEIINIFSRLGFTVSEGPEIEDDNRVFSLLNFPPEHPARDMQDTFYIERSSETESNRDDILLRTHTSSVQVRVMQTENPPIRTISPGRVFRNEAISARAHCIFHQVEGLFIDRNVSFADLRQTLFYFAREMFGKETKIRLRPSFFPFTEPSAEMDASCTICGGNGCNVCKHTGWLEVLGCGMVDPNVLDFCGINSKEYTGFAFGMGIERIAMLKYRVNDLRLYFENDVRFLGQFRSAF